MPSTHFRCGCCDMDREAHELSKLSQLAVTVGIKQPLLCIYCIPNDKFDDPTYEPQLYRCWAKLDTDVKRWLVLRHMNMKNDRRKESVMNASPVEQDQLLTYTEAAEKYKINKNTLAGWVFSGILNKHEVGKNPVTGKPEVRVKASEIEELLASKSANGRINRKALAKTTAPKTTKPRAKKRKKTTRRHTGITVAKSLAKTVMDERDWTANQLAIEVAKSGVISRSGFHGMIKGKRQSKASTVQAVIPVLEKLAKGKATTPKPSSNGLVGQIQQLIEENHQLKQRVAELEEVERLVQSLNS